MEVLSRAAQCAWTCLWLATTALAAGEPVNSPPATYDEYEVKAAMLYNFTKFIDWPARTFRGPGAPFVIGILGSDPFGARLDALLESKSINGHPVVVHRFALPEDVRNCQVLFVSAAGTDHVRRVLQALGRSATLTVGDGGQFAGSGGVIGFVLDGRRIRFEINLDAAGRAGLHVSSKLLRLATVRRDSARQARN